MFNSRRFAFIATLSLGICAVPRCAQAQSVLFIGNSFTFAHYGKQAQAAGGVPELFARIARQDGHTPKTQMVAPPGSTLRQHFDNKSGEVTVIQSKKWDYVVLQANTLETTSAASHPGDFLKYGQKLAQLIRQNNPATKIVLYETWAYPKKHPIFAEKFTDQAQMLAQVAAGYRALSDEIKADGVAPVGDAFDRAENSSRHYDLYASATNYHGNDTGYTLAALVIAHTIYGRLPTKPSPILSDILPEDMETLTSIAKASARAWQHPIQP